MPTRRISRALRRPGGGGTKPQVISDACSLVDVFNAMRLCEFPVLPVSHQAGRGILGRGLSGDIRQAGADAETILVFKPGVPSMRERDDNYYQDWSSLAAEMMVLGHPTIRENHHIIQLLGVAFSVDASTGTRATAWPLLVTRRANLGNLELLLSRTEGQADGALRWQLFAEVAEAVYLLHASGVSHGDIKPSNFVVEQSGDQVNCELIDFGSCAVRGQDRLPTLNPPWNAPELREASHPLGFEYLAQADLFSLGLLWLHILLPLEVLAGAGICFLRSGQSDAAWEATILRLEQLKSAGPEPNDLASCILQTVAECALPRMQIQLLESVVRRMIMPTNGSRSAPWDDVLRLAKDHLSVDFITADNIPAVQPPTRGVRTESSPGHDKHALFELPLHLGELDDSHYIVRQTTLRDLEYKAQHSPCSECCRHYALMVAVSYWIGFGCIRDCKTKDKWLLAAGMSQADADALVDKIDREYQGTNRLPAHVLNELGIGVLQTADRAEEYQASGRLFEAETCLRAEIEAREAVFGSAHRCTIRLYREWAQVLRQQGRYEGAEAAQKMAVEATERAYGVDHSSSAMARLALADIWTGQGFPLKAKPIHIQDVPVLERALGADHPDVLVAMQQQAFALASEGRLQEAGDIVHRVIAKRSSVFGPEHPLTVKSQLSLVTILRADGRIKEAVEHMRAIEVKMRGALEGERMTEVTILLAQALVYNEMWHHEDAMERITKAHSVLDKMHLGPHDSLRLQAYEVQAAIYHTSHQMGKEEALLRQLLEGLDAEPHLNRASRTSTLALLSRNLLWQGRHREARMMAEALNHSLGPTPLQTDVDSYIASARNMADALSAEGQQTAAEEVLRRAYQACVDQFDLGHYTTVQVAESLADFWNQQRRYTESQECLEGILDKVRRQPGRSAVKVAQKLAVVYRELGELERAANLCSEAVQWASAAGGELHQNTLAVWNILASIRIRAGDLVDAERILTRIDRQCRDPRLSGYIKVNMRYLRTHQGRHQEALELAREGARLLEGTYDPSDRLIQEAHVLRELLQLEGLKDKNLEQEILDNIRRRGEIQGEANPGRVAMMADLAYHYGLSRRLHDAKNLFDQIEKLGGINERQQPAECATLLGKQADVSFRLGQLAEAEALERRALNIRLRIHGEDHASVLATKSNLASTLSALHRYPEAEDLLREILQVRMQQTVPAQPGSPETASPQSMQKLLATKRDLASVLFYQGRLTEALSILEGALETVAAGGASPGMVAQMSEMVQMVRKKINASIPGV
ncbi:hypothetical protein B0T16DRAFT_493705 [Cercophora newfieldiana]|uniref:Protein kinase domain-containing protein n=1 Tax=Cercophora newfieldiana TaxID=92897 RepID=A0AA39Y6U1_9PEZI|nr:hypothetical protein B0T16DRAFT_493705 [Cercophora newfieldiana]